MTPTAYPAPSAVLELLKPITWFPPMWAFACGVVSSGVPIIPNWPIALIGIILAGPLICAMSQAINDWYDRDVDAINEPHRPIPSGRIPGKWGLYIAAIWTVLSLLVALSLGQWVFWSAVIGLVLAWVTGAAAMLGGALPTAPSLIMAGIYSAGAHGIMTLNDFKSIRGDQQMGINSLPVLLGTTGAAKTACAIMAAPQFIVIALLLTWGRPLQAAIVGVFLAAQLALMARFLKTPVEKASWYSGFGVPLYVFGMMACAFAIRGLQ